MSEQKSLTLRIRECFPTNELRQRVSTEQYIWGVRGRYTYCTSSIGDMSEIDYIVKRVCDMLDIYAMVDSAGNVGYTESTHLFDGWKTNNGCNSLEHGCSAIFLYNPKYKGVADNTQQILDNL